MVKIKKKPFKIAAWCFIIALALGFFVGAILGAKSYFPIDYKSSPALPVFLVIYNIILATLLIIANYGFIQLGRKFNNKLLIIMSWFGIIAVIVLALYLIFGSLFINVPTIPNAENYESWLESDGPMKAGIFMILTHLIISIVVGIGTIIFGISLLKMKRKVKYAKAAGILNIVTGATMIVFVGYLVFYAAVILEILLLFEASRRFEKGKK